MGFNDLLEQLDSDADNFVTEYLERKLEDYVTILLGIIFKLEIDESTYRTSTYCCSKECYMIYRTFS